MDTAIRSGDYQRGSGGTPFSIDGFQELLQRALIQLTVKKGSFLYDSQLGSELSSLKATPGGADALTQKAAQMVREALAPLSEISLQNVLVKMTDDAERMELTVLLKAGGQQSELEVAL